MIEVWVGLCVFYFGRRGFDKSIERAGKPIPGYLYRMWFEQQVSLSLHDRGMAWFACVLFWEEGVRVLLKMRLQAKLFCTYDKKC